MSYYNHTEQTSCEVYFRSSDIEVRSLLEKTLSELYTSADFLLQAGVLRIIGVGQDGRCAACRRIRKEAKEAGILFSARCRSERDDSFSWRVMVGRGAFDITLLEREEYYQQRKQQDMNDLVARTHLAALAECRGQWAVALAEYAIILKHTPRDAFTRQRAREVSEKLWEQKRAGLSAPDVSAVQLAANTDCT